jgi:hypothetical protein
MYLHTEVRDTGPGQVYGEPILWDHTDWEVAVTPRAN